MEEFQIRIQDDFDGEEEVRCFTDLHEARVQYARLVRERRAWCSMPGALAAEFHCELVEVLEQDCVETEVFNGSSDL